MVRERLDGLAHLRAFEPHPPSTDVHQRRAGRFGAHHVGNVDDLAVDRQRPLDEGLGVEPARADSRGCRRGLSLHACRRTQQLLGPEQLDVGGLDARCRFEQCADLVDVEFEQVGLGRVEEAAQRRHRRAQPHGGAHQLLGEHRNVTLVSSDIDGERTHGPHVAGGAPTSGVGRIGDLQADAPRLLDVGGHVQPKPTAYDWFAGGAPALVVEHAGHEADVFERAVRAVGRSQPRAPRIGEGLERAADRGHRTLAGVGERGRPALPPQCLAGDRIDQFRDHVVEVERARRIADRRALGPERGDGGGDDVVHDRHPAGVDADGILGDDRRHPAADGDLGGELHRLVEPAQRRRPAGRRRTVGEQLDEVGDRDPQALRRTSSLARQVEFEAVDPTDRGAGEQPGVGGEQHRGRRGTGGVPHPEARRATAPGQMCIVGRHPATLVARRTDRSGSLRCALRSTRWMSILGLGPLLTRSPGSTRSSPLSSWPPATSRRRHGRSPVGAMTR